MRRIAIAGTAELARHLAGQLGAFDPVTLIGPAARADAEAGVLERLRHEVTDLFLVPRDLEECEAFLFDREALARGSQALRRIVIFAALSPRFVRALRGRVPARIALIDAAFAGSARAAEAGRGAVFLGGEPEEIAPLRDCFDRIADKTIRMGEFGTGIAARVMTELLAASTSAMTRVMLDWADAQGIEDAGLQAIGAALPPRPEGIGRDIAGTAGAGEHVRHLVRNLQSALDAALGGAHLMPPQAAKEAARAPKLRPLH